MSTDTAATNADTAVRPFHVDIAEEAIADLRRRIAAWRPPEQEPVGDQSQGVQLATVRDLASYWATDYDWRRCQAKLNALPQFTTTIDGLEIHFIHVRSAQQDALPLIVSHGWPGSVIEQLKIIEPLTNPAGHGGSALDAFDVVIPSLPGYGFSGKPAATGWDPDRIARAWAVLMQRLGYARYVAQGGDWGTAISAAMGRQAPDGLLGIHVNFAQMVPPDVLGHIRNGDPAPAGLSDAEKHAYGQVAFATYHRGYGVIQGTRPQTIGYSLADTPVGLAAWLLDHDATTYQHLAQLFAGQSYGAITREDWLDNTSLYWLTNTATSAARLYWQQAITGKNFYAPADVSLPAAVTVFPEEYVTAPRSWTEQAYQNLIYFHHAERGGHFAAWEQPQLFSEELRAAFRPLRLSKPGRFGCSHWEEARESVRRQKFAAGLDAFLAAAGGLENQPFVKLLLQHGLRQPDRIKTDLGTTIGTTTEHLPVAASQSRHSAGPVAASHGWMSMSVSLIFIRRSAGGDQAAGGPDVGSEPG